MERLFLIDWEKFYVPTHSLAEMMVRGSVMYLALFVFLRFLGRRQSGSIGTADLLVIMLIADAAQNGMAHEYKSVTEGIVLVLTILGWNFLIDWASYHFPRLRPLLSQPAVCLIRDGKLQRRNMRKEMVTEEELLGQLRQKGLESPSLVRLAQLEADGQISVVATGPA